MNFKDDKENALLVSFRGTFAKLHKFHVGKGELGVSGGHTNKYRCVPIQDIQQRVMYRTISKFTLSHSCLHDIPLSFNFKPSTWPGFPWYKVVAQANLHQRLFATFNK